MINQVTTKAAVSESVQCTFSLVASQFIQDSLDHMIPWLIASFFVVMCDLGFGVRKSLLMGEEVRFSSACRRTMGKLVTYFAFVCMVVTVNIASGSLYDIDTYSCLFVCFIEGCSIVSNILKPKGYNFNLIKAVGLLLNKAVGVAKDDVETVITKE